MKKRACTVVVCRFCQRWWTVLSFSDPDVHLYRDREPFERFYCGVPLVASDGHRLGTMCVGGREPRSMEGHMVRLNTLSRFAACFFAITCDGFPQYQRVLHCRLPALNVPPVQSALLLHHRRRIAFLAVSCRVCGRGRSRREHGKVLAQVNVLTGMAEMVTRSLEKDWIVKQRRESTKLLLSADLKVLPPTQLSSQCRYASG